LEGINGIAFLAGRGLACPRPKTGQGGFMINQLKIMAVLILTFTFTFIFTGCDENNGKDKTKELLSLSMLECSGEGATYAIGDTGPSGVGKVFYITCGGLHGLEAAPADLSAMGMAWSTITNAYANGKRALPKEIGTGSANTDAIIAQNGGAASAAKSCRDYSGGGMTDWFLPSIDELAELYGQKDIVGGFTGNPYWSSSEVDASDSWFLYFPDGGRYHSNKGNNHAVRAVRAF
jgi:hypothetical protein